jgi:hypothetical protein
VGELGGGREGEGGGKGGRGRERRREGRREGRKEGGEEEIEKNFLQSYKSPPYVSTVLYVQSLSAGVYLTPLSIAPRISKTLQMPIH